MTSDDARMMTPEEREMLEREAAEYLASCDPELVLITDYLAGELDADARKAVERRLDEDDAFFEKAWPSIQIWNHPGRYSELFADLDARDRAAADPSSGLPDELTERMHHAVREIVGLPSHGSKPSLSKPVASPPARVGSARWWRQRAESPGWRQAAGIIWLLLNLAGVSTVAYLMFRDVETERAKPAPSLDSSKLPKTGHWKATDSAQRVALRDGTIIILAPGSEASTVDVRSPASWLVPTMMLRGDAVIEYSRSFALNLMVPTGRASLRSGRHIVHATDDEATFTVERGHATVYGSGGAYALPAKIAEGQTARVRRGERSEIVDSSNTKRP